MAKQCERYGCRREAVIKFCSENCKIAHHNAQRDRKNDVKGKCASCGKEFVGRANKRTCSNVCRQRFYQSKIVKVKVKVPKGLRTGLTVELPSNDEG